MACTSNTHKEISKIPTEGRFPFEELKGIYFQEAHRTFKNGLAYNEMGFEQEPSWDIQFKSNDTVSALYPQTKKMFDFYLHYDHGQVYNFAEEWFRLISANRDSLVFQRLEVNSMKIKSGIESDVYMKFYAKNYITDSIHTTIEKLRAPSAKDTVFVKSMIDWMNSGSKEITHEKYFAARKPPVFVSTNPNISVKKITRNYGSIQKNSAYEYLYPEYDVDIRNAIKDFSFSFAALVDTKGNFTLNYFETVPEFQEARNRYIQGLLDAYIEPAFKTTPGSTLGIPQTSMVYFNLRGKTHE